MKRRKQKQRQKRERWDDVYRSRPPQRWKEQDWFDRRARELRTMPSEAEKALWEHLRLSRTGHLFHWNYPYPPYIIDFVCFNCAVIVEVDGEFHGNQQLADEERDRFFDRKKAVTLRFMAKDVLHDPAWVAACIKKVCDSRVGVLSSL